MYLRAGRGGDLQSVIKGDCGEPRIDLPAECFENFAFYGPAQGPLDGADVLLDDAPGALPREDIDQPLEPHGLFFQAGDLSLRSRRLMTEDRHQPLFTGVRRGDSLLSLLHDLSSLGQALPAFGQCGITAAELLPASIKARNRARIARREIGQHRHGLQGIAAIIERQQQAHVTQPAETVESAETFPEKLFLFRDAWCERGDLPFDVAL